MGFSCYGLGPKLWTTSRPVFFWCIGCMNPQKLTLCTGKMQLHMSSGGSDARPAADSNDNSDGGRF